MKARILTFAAILFSATLIFFTACKKDTAPVDTTSDEASKHTDDQSSFSSDMDDIDNDASLALESTTSFSGKGEQVQVLPCNATIVLDTLSNPRKITITYNGLSCLGNVTRTGVVVISMPANVRWKDAGAAITVDCQNLHITRVIDNKSITINGAHVYTNVSGGLLWNLPVLQTITHDVTSNGMTVTFDNGSQRSWQVAKRRVFTYSGGVVITTTGLHTEGNITGVAEWGTNRFGHAFTSAIATPVVIRQDCSFRITGGKITHKTTMVDASATFGLDATGVPTSCPGLGHYYMKIEWIGLGGTPHSIILPY